MNSKQKKTLDLIFKTPVPSRIKSKDIDSLIVGLGGLIQERSGSRVAFRLNGFGTVVHRPHPQKEYNRLTVKHIREFLKEAGI